MGTVIELSKPEFHAAARRALASLGISYTQLAAQARHRRFDSDRAASVWAVLGGTLPDDFT
jgi:hypothetical protein